MSTTSTFRASGPATDELSAGAEQFTVSGGDWDDVVAQIAERDEADRLRNDRIVLNMGPVHPSTHGVLRLVLEADGEVVTRSASVPATCTPVSRRHGVPHLGPG